MGIEIERKFLVVDSRWKSLGTPELLRQGYLNAEPERTVRVRVQGEQAWLTIKGRSEGAARAEWEYPIPLNDANELLDRLCLQPFVEKTRTRVPLGGHVWEVDEFLGANAGLVVAEIELASEEEHFEKPDWIGAEVTGDPRYYNSSLIKRPFKTW